MNTAPWNKVEAALDELLALPISERPAALTQLSANDLAMRAELESLLPYMDGGDELLDGAALDAIATLPNPGLRRAGELIGDFRIISLVGRGGMGEVYKAERIGVDFKQIVALKLIRSDAVGPVERFHHSDVGSFQAGAAGGERVGIPAGAKIVQSFVE